MQSTLQSYTGRGFQEGRVYCPATTPFMAEELPMGVNSQFQICASMRMIQGFLQVHHTAKSENPGSTETGVAGFLGNG